MPITVTSANAKTKAAGRLRPVVSLRLSPQTLALLDRVTAQRAKDGDGWRRGGPTRTALIEEAVTKHFGLGVRK